MNILEKIGLYGILIVGFFVCFIATLFILILPLILLFNNQPILALVITPISLIVLFFTIWQIGTL